MDGHPRLRRVRARISKLVAADPGWLRLVILVVAFRCMLAILAFASFEGGPTVLRELAVVITCDRRCFQFPWIDIRVKQLRSPACPTLRTWVFSMGEGPPAPLRCFRDRPPAGTCRNTHAGRRARLCRTMLLPVYPLRSIRRSQGRGVSRQIALRACQPLGPTVPYPCRSAVRSRRPALSAFASESHLRAPGGISGPAGHPARGTRPSSRGSRVSMHRFARGQPSPSICSRNPERQVAARLETPF